MSILATGSILAVIDHRMLRSPLLEWNITHGNDISHAAVMGINEKDTNDVAIAISANVTSDLHVYHVTSDFKVSAEEILANPINIITGRKKNRKNRTTTRKTHPPSTTLTSCGRICRLDISNNSRRGTNRAGLRWWRKIKEAVEPGLRIVKRMKCLDMRDVLAARKVLEDAAKDEEKDSRNEKKSISIYLYPARCGPE